MIDDGAEDKRREHITDSKYTTDQRGSDQRFGREEHPESQRKPDKWVGDGSDQRIAEDGMENLGWGASGGHKYVIIVWL